MMLRALVSDNVRQKTNLEVRVTNVALLAMSGNNLSLLPKQKRTKVSLARNKSNFSFSLKKIDRSEQKGKIRALYEQGKNKNKAKIGTGTGQDQDKTRTTIKTVNQKRSKVLMIREGSSP